MSEYKINLSGSNFVEQKTLLFLEVLLYIYLVFIVVDVDIVREIMEVAGEGQKRELSMINAM